MHDLTKKECDKALDRVSRFCSFYAPYKDAEHLKLHGELYILKRLIDEHFLKPPLAWEEIEEGDFVWDKHFTVIGGEWLKVYEKRITKYGEKVLVCGACGCGVVQTRSYVEDRFYR